MPPVKSPPQRRLVDRLRQIALFELGGLLLITPPFMWLSGVGLEHSLGLLASAALVAALWNAAYNIGFDRVEGHLTGRTADRRPWRLRVIHAIGFERQAGDAVHLFLVASFTFRVLGPEALVVLGAG